MQAAAESEQEAALRAVEAAEEAEHEKLREAARAAAAKGGGACDCYRVDMTATTFGLCHCGQPKSAHSEAATVHGAEGAVPLSGHDKPTDLRYPKSGGGRAARLAAQRALVNEKLGANLFVCENYRVDLKAARFGDCVCGYPKSAHTISSIGRGKKK